LRLVKKIWRSLAEKSPFGQPLISFNTQNHRPVQNFQPENFVALLLRCSNHSEK